MNTQSNLLLEILIKKLETSARTKAEKIAVHRLRKLLKAPYALEYHKRLQENVSNHSMPITNEIVDEAYEYLKAAHEINIEQSTLTDEEKEVEKTEYEASLKEDIGKAKDILRREGVLK